MVMSRRRGTVIVYVIGSKSRVGVSQRRWPAVCQRRWPLYSQPVAGCFAANSVRDCMLGPNCCSTICKLADLRLLGRQGVAGNQPDHWCWPASHLLTGRRSANWQIIIRQLEDMLYSLIDIKAAVRGSCIQLPFRLCCEAASLRLAIEMPPPLADGRPPLLAYGKSFINAISLFCVASICSANCFIRLLFDRSMRAWLVSTAIL
jgi:hypothetical protein